MPDPPPETILRNDDHEPPAREPSGPQSVRTCATRQAALESQLVLEAVRIPSRLISSGHGWELLVEPRQWRAAQRELQAYDHEQAAESTQVETRATTHDDAWTGVLLYAATIVSVYVLADVSAYDSDWLAAGQMRAGDVWDGQWYRTVTALTLHADGTHLANNLAFGGLFGFLAGRILGGGVAWLLILLGGAAGNLLNASLRPDAFVSIGASTAVFAAWGLLVAHAIQPPRSSTQTPLRRWTPLICGILMFSLLGLEGERTDVLAHVTGFVCGIVLGGASRRLPAPWLTHPWTQPVTAITAVAIITAAWRIALRG